MKMNTTTFLIAVLAVSLYGTSAFGQRRDSVIGRANTPPISVSDPGSPNWDVNERSPANPNVELAFNDKLTVKLKTLLPEGTDPRSASKGFTELKEFVATVRAASNLKVPFGELKHKMAGGSSKELQKAIHELKPDVDPKAETRKANEQAKQDLKESKQS